MLQQELETYKKHFQELLADAGKFALVKEDEIVGRYSTYGEAIREGYENFGTAPFLVKQIEVVEQVQHVSRVPVCHPSQ